MAKITYRIKHVGINNENEAQAQQLVDVLCGLFGLERTKETPAAIFGGEIFEVMKHSNIGKNGHIAMQTEDVEAAMAELSAKGITFRENTIRRDENGKINFIYLEQEFGGFAFHLTV